MNQSHGCAPVLEHDVSLAEISLGNRTPAVAGAAHTQENVTLICCQGRIVYGRGSSLLSEKVASLLPHTRQIVLDLSQVQMIDGTGLGELVAIWMQAQASHRSVKFAAPSRRIRNILELTKLDSFLPIYATLEDALDSFRTRAAAR